VFPPHTRGCNSLFLIWEYAQSTLPLFRVSPFCSLMPEYVNERYLPPERVRRANTPKYPLFRAYSLSRHSRAEPRVKFILIPAPFAEVFWSKSPHLDPFWDPFRSRYPMGCYYAPDTTALHVGIYWRLEMVQKGVPKGVQLATPISLWNDVIASVSCVSSFWSTPNTPISTHLEPLWDHLYGGEQHCTIYYSYRPEGYTVCTAYA